MCTRAVLLRTITLVAALLVAASTTSVSARECRAADTQSEDYPIVQALRFMSRTAWASLSDEDQAIFREAARRSSRFMRERWEDLEEQSRRKAEAAGVTIVTDFDRRQFEEAIAGIYRKAQRDPPMATLIEQIREVD